MIDVLEQITYAIVDEEEHEKRKEKELLEKMVNFILTLEPDQLDDNQLEETIDILEIIDPGEVDFTMIMSEEYTDDDRERNKEYYKKHKGEYRKRKYPRAKRTQPKDKFDSRVYKRKNRNKIRIRKRKLLRSAEGRKRLRQKDRLERIHKTPTKRKMVRYNPVRKKRAKNRPSAITLPQIDGKTLKKQRELKKKNIVIKKAIEVNRKRKEADIDNLKT